ncbi:MAG TPA: hypothetical protein DEP12_12760 [Planctomycetaceae bacterium]|nr:hypothetical protein [Planctomycetaceae bacterium]
MSSNSIELGLAVGLLVGVSANVEDSIQKGLMQNAERTRKPPRPNVNLVIFILISQVSVGCAVRQKALVFSLSIITFGQNL